MLFHAYFTERLGTKVRVILKNNMSVDGVLAAADPYMNIRLSDARVADSPILCALKDCSIRGSAIKYLRLPPDETGMERLTEATRVRCSLGQ